MTDWQLGLQAFREGRMREAADRLQAALEENELSTSLAARYETCAYLGAALYALGLPTEAVNAFEAAFQFSPTPVPPEELTMNLAHAYLASGRRDAAREALRFLVFHAPGHVAANMLAARLDSSPADDKIKGVILGTSPETAHAYIRTLTFTRSTFAGYNPAEVQEALGQLGRFINSLTHELAQAEAKNAQYELEILRYRQIEDAVVENMVQIQRQSSQDPILPGDSEDKSQSELSPIEILFQQKS